jgi:hypothetical protein
VEIRTPHWAQNIAPAWLLAPQSGQVALNCAPQLEQKVAPLVTSVSHFGQRIPVSYSANDKYFLMVPFILTENREERFAGSLFSQFS